MLKLAQRGFLRVFLVFSVLLGLLLLGLGNFVLADSESLVPLTDMGEGTYYGYRGGLYPEGQNAMPQAHLDAGLALSQQVVPRDGDGQQSASGKVVLLSIGMSNTNMEFEQFRKSASNDSALNPALVVVNGAQGGMTAAKIQNPNDNASGTQYWAYVDQKLAAAGVTRMQVQAAWLKEADSGPSGSPITYAQKLQQEQVAIAQVLGERFPNLKLLYFSSRIYGGYATTQLNPEPYAYVSGFSVKWLIEAQINGNSDLNYDLDIGAVKAPGWLGDIGD